MTNFSTIVILLVVVVMAATMAVTSAAHLRGNKEEREAKTLRKLWWTNGRPSNRPTATKPSVLPSANTGSTSNGIIIIGSGVGATITSRRNIIELAEDTSSLSTLVFLLEESGLNDVLEEDGPL